MLPFALAVWGMKVLNCRRSTMWSRSLGRGRSLVAGIYATAFPQLDRPCQSLVASGHIGHTGPTISIHPCCINPETPLVTESSGKWIVWPQPWNHPSLYQPLLLSLSSSRKPSGDFQLWSHENQGTCYGEGRPGGCLRPSFYLAATHPLFLF